GNMLHLAQESADERHVAHFAFGDEAIRNAESAHQRENVEVAGVIRSVNLCSGCGHVLFARDANPNASEEEEKFYCSRCVAAGGAVIVEEKDASAGGNDPDGEQNDEVDAVEKLEAAAKSAHCVAKEILCRAGRAQAGDLQPGRSFFRAERSSDVELASLLAAEFATGGFGNTARGNEFHAIGRKPKAGRDLLGDR